MPTRDTFNPGRLPFVADVGSLSRNNGRQIAWDLLTDAWRNGTVYTVTVNDADAMEGDVALTVDALPVALPISTVLDFGALAADAFTITVDDATAIAGDVALGVLALPVAIPAGAVLQFSGAPGDVDEIAVVGADAAAGATSLTVLALPHAIADTATASYPGVAQRMLAKLSAAAAAGATALVVEPLAGPITDNATASFAQNGSGKKGIPSGTVMAELSTGQVIPREAVTGAETSMGLLETEAVEDHLSHALTGYGVIVGGVIYQNLLPDFANAAWASTWRGELVANGVGNFVWQTYADDTT